MSFFKSFFASCLGSVLAMIVVVFGLVWIISLSGGDEVVIGDNSVLHLDLDVPIVETERADPLAGVPFFGGNAPRPVGLAQLHHAGIFSPAAVRRLINEAKKHYEVVLIDTGPILGSIEATPVCASADGVILTVARGQQRPLVEKALDHLKGIGARVAGVVFNRAQAKDFESSISGISMRSASRSASNGHGHNREGGQFGPIARAVASSVKPTDGADKN